MDVLKQKLADLLSGRLGGWVTTQPNYSTIKDTEEENKKAIVLCKHKPLFSVHNLISFLLGYMQLVLSFTS